MTMTVKKLMEVLNAYASIFGDDFTSLPIVAVGYNINGERQYNIPVIDYTFNLDEDTFTLWDR